MARELSIAAHRTLHPCLVPDCEEPAILSHVVQEQILRKELANGRNQVRLLRHNEFRPYRLEFCLTGPNASLSFRGFCAAHDNQIFAPIESGGFDPTSDTVTYVHAVLYTIRSIGYELRKCENLLVWYDSILSNPDLSSAPRRDSPLTWGAWAARKRVQMSRDLADWTFLLSRFRRELRSPSGGHAFTVSISRRIDIVISSAYGIGMHVPGSELRLKYPYLVLAFPRGEWLVSIEVYANTHPTHPPLPDALFRGERGRRPFGSKTLTDLMMTMSEDIVVSTDLYDRIIRPQETYLLREKRRLHGQMTSAGYDIFATTKSS